MPKLDFEITRDLQAAGASQDLAEAVVRAISEKQIANLATKADLIDIRTELVENRETLRSELAEIRSCMATTDELGALELRLTEKMSAMFTKMIIWLVGAVIASVTLMATIGQLLK